MKTFYKYAAFAAVSLLGLCACSSDDDTSAETTGKPVLQQPQIVVSELTTTGFTISWAAIDGAASYAYTFNGGEETSTDGNRIAFDNLERQKEYVVAVKSCPKYPDEFKESAYAYIHVLTDELEQLPAPKITLGCAYASKTIISWTEVPETSLYEYTIDGKTQTTAERTVSMSNLRKGTSYSFTVRAMTADATRFANSEPAELPFVTSADDVPAIIIAPTYVISDAVEFEISAPAEQTYYYEILPATTFAKNTPEKIMTTFREYIVTYAEQQGISLQLAMASLLKSGTQRLQITGLTPELSYVIFAFGMDLKGQITTGLYSAPFKTTADGYSDGPNYGGSEWFTQRFFLSNGMGYNWTNSIFTIWKGEDVVDLRYRTLKTDLFLQVFPDPYDKQALTAFLKDPSYGLLFNPALLPLTVNSANGYNGLTEVNAGTSYTLFSLATSSSGAETLCVNSATTKTSTEAKTWFLAQAMVNEVFGPTHNIIAGIMQGVEIASVRYAIYPQSTLADIPEANYPAVIEKYGRDVKDEDLVYVNSNGLAILFSESSGIEPETNYVFMATAVNTVGDKITKWGSAATTAAPAAETAKRAPTRAGTDGLHISPAGIRMPDPEKFIFPLQTTQLPADAKLEGDLWTIIHNKFIFK